MFSKRLIQSGHTREFLIRHHESSGWEIREAQDNRVIRLHQSADWHHVERTRAVFERQIDLLEQAGWVEV
jgi:hypothetical protein